MKKVLILVNHDVVIYNFRLELVERLLSEDFEVIVCSPYGERIEDLINIGCKYIEVQVSRRSKNIFQDFKLLKSYLQIIKSEQPDVVLTYTVKPNIYGGLACSLLKVPFIANITGGIATSADSNSVIEKVIPLLYKLAFRKVHMVFFQNKESKHFFVDKKIALGRHSLIPGSGVNLDYFSPIIYPANNNIEFIFISRIMKQKGIEQYLDAAKYIRKKYPNTRFHILGFCEENYEDELKLLEKQEVVIYHGMQRDIREFLKITHCTIHPTYYPEGMSNVLLESAASARPIITTNRSGCREIVEEGVTGYIVEQKNTQDLIDKIELFLNKSHDEKKKMGILGRLKVEKEFSREIVVNAYLDEIKKNI